MGKRKKPSMLKKFLYGLGVAGKNTIEFGEMVEHPGLEG